MVEVQGQHGHEAAPPLETPKRAIHPLEEEPPVWQVGQGVVEGDVCRAILAPCLLPGLEGEGDKVRDGAREEGVFGREVGRLLAHALVADHPDLHPRNPHRRLEQRREAQIFVRVAKNGHPDLGQHFEAVGVEDRGERVFGQVAVRASHVEVLAAQGATLIVVAPERRSLGLEHGGPGLEHGREVGGGGAFRGFERRAGQLHERAEMAAMDLLAGLCGDGHAVSGQTSTRGPRRTGHAEGRMAE